MGYLGAKLTQVLTLAGAERSCHNSPDGNQGYRVRVTSRTRSARRIWGILKKSVELSPASGEDGLLSLAHGGLATGAHVLGGRWKSQNRKNVYLSPYVEEPLNSKVMKCFVPELRSRQVFFVFRDSYVLCIFVMNIICMFHTYPYSYHGYGTH